MFALDYVRIRRSTGAITAHAELFSTQRLFANKTHFWHLCGSERRVARGGGSCLGVVLDYRIVHLALATSHHTLVLLSRWTSFSPGQ